MSHRVQVCVHIVIRVREHSDLFAKKGRDQRVDPGFPYKSLRAILALLVLKMKERKRDVIDFPADLAIAQRRQIYFSHTNLLNLYNTNFKSQIPNFSRMAYETMKWKRSILNLQAPISISTKRVKTCAMQLGLPIN